MQPITAGTGLVAETQPTSPFLQTRCQLDQNLRTVLENSDLADLTAAAALGKRDANRRLVNIQSDIGDTIHQARLPRMRLCIGHPAHNPRHFACREAGRRSLSEHRV
jgi:hypothetical protein